MLDQETRKRIDNARDVLVGKVPNPQSQVEQITIALIYKFMDDMDRESVSMGGVATFFSGDFEKYSWTRIFDPKTGGHKLIELYREAIEKMNFNPNIPQLFRDIFKNAYLPYRDPETLKLFLKEIDGFSYDHSERLGDAFEYLLSVLSAQGDAGQFRTPRHIIDFIVEVVNPRKEQTILDPACGTAGFLISAYKHIQKTNGIDTPGDQLSADERSRLMENFAGYDISPDMIRLSLVNMYLHGFLDPQIHEYDTLTSDNRWDETYDVILANPPFMTPKGGIRPHKRFSIQAKRSEVLFVDYIAEHLNPGGRAGVIVPEGIIFQSSNAYKALRKMLVDNYLWAVVSLPAGIFQPYSGVKTSILLMDKAKAKQSDSILFVKVENDGFDLGAQRRPNGKDDLPEALRILKSGDAEGSELAHWVEKSRIAESGDWNLSGERYRINDDLKMTKFEMVELEKITDVFIDGDWVESKDQSDSGIRLIQTGNVGFGEYLDKYNRAKFISDKKFEEINCTEVFPGDVLISRLPDPVGRACIIPQLSTRMITAVDCTIIRFKNEKMLPTLFVNYTKTDNYYQNIKQYLTGSSRTRISRSNLAKVKIPLPPLSVQKDIVAEIDGYQKIINGARQVVDNWKPIIKIDPSWESVQLEKVSTFKNGIGFLKENKGKGIRILGVGNFKNNLIASISEADEINPDGVVNESNLLKKDDIIFVRSNGNPKLVGRSMILGDIKETVTHSAFTIRLRFIHEKILPMFYAYLFKSPIFRNKLTGRGANIMNLTQDILKELLIPLPPLSIQQEIVAHIEAEQEMVNANKKLIDIYEQKIKDKIAEVWGE